MKEKADEAQNKTQILKELREKHKESVARTQSLVKDQNTIRRQIRQALGDEAKTIPQVAQGSGLPIDQVLWHMMAMKKYGLIQEQGMDGEYYMSELKKEQ